MELGTTVPARHSTKCRALLGVGCISLALVLAAFVSLQPRSSPTQAGHFLSDQEAPTSLHRARLRDQVDEDLDSDAASDYGDEVAEVDARETFQADEGEIILDELDEVLEEDASKSSFPAIDCPATLREVRKAMTPWSGNTTHYSFAIHFCKSGDVNTCRKGPSGYFSRRRAGCLSAPECKVFYTDCSGFVGWCLIVSTKGRNKTAIYDHLKKVRPGMKRPLAKDFYAAFKHQQDKNNADESVPWKHVSLKDAKPGDVIAWHHGPGNYTTTGHVMMVAGKAQYKGKNQRGRNEYWVRIVDSTNIPHAWDTRHECHKGRCGVGFGTMAYETFANGDISGFQWRAGHRRRHVVNRNEPTIVGRFIR